MKRGNQVAIGLMSGESWSSNWTTQKIADTFLFYGETSKITGGKLYNQVTGSSDWLVVGGSAGTYTFQAPHNATYETADTDFVWFTPAGGQRTVTEAELVEYDIPRTPVKFDDAGTNAIRKIGILKTGVTLTGSSLNQLFSFFDLPILWDNSLNPNGHLKDNRTGQNLYDYYAVDIINRMVAATETPTSARKANIQTTIKSLRAEGLFETRFDGFGITRGKGALSTKMNWIKDAHNLTKGGAGTLTYTEDVGYTSDGTTYLRTNYIPSSDAVKMSQNNASFGNKISGVVAAGATGSGSVSTAGGTRGISLLSSATASYFSCNDWTHPAGLVLQAAGYNAVARNNANNFDSYVNAGTSNDASLSVGLPTRELFILCINDDGVPHYFETTTSELWFFGAYITQAEFNKIRTIINSYIAAL